MAFGSISTFYFPTDANSGASQWGTDVRKLLDTADAATDLTTSTRTPANATPTRITVDPYTSNATGDNTESNYGWAVTPSDMNSVSGARRLIKAGNHVCTLRLIANGIGPQSVTLHTFIYRVGPAAGRTRTLIASQSDVLSVDVAVNGADTVVTLSVPEIIFEPDETIQYSFETTATGAVLTARTVTFRTGTQNGTAVRVDHPGLTIIRDTAGASDGAGTVSGAIQAFGSFVASAAGVAAVAGLMSSMGAGVGEAPGAAAASAVGASQATTIGTSAGAAAVVGSITGIGSAAGNASGAAAADGIVGAIASAIGAADATATTDGRLASTAGAVASANGVAAVDGQGGSLAGTIATAAGVAAAEGLITGIGAATGTTTGAAQVDAIVTAITSATGSADGAAAVNGLMTGIGSATGAAAGAAAADGGGASLAGTVATTAGAATVDGATGTIAGTVGAATVGGAAPPAIVRTTILIFDD